MSTAKHRLVLCVLGVSLLAGFALVERPEPAGAGSVVSVRVAFLQGEQLARVTRPGTTAADAVRQLIAGPTRAEVKRGYRTYIPAGTRVLNASVADGLATVDLDERFTSGGDADSLLARLSQLVRTLTGLQGATKVQLLIDGAPIAGMFPGIPVTGPITLQFLQTPNIAVPVPPQLRLPPPDAGTKTLQQRLIALGYLLPGDSDGRFGPGTQNAILAFQKWERLNRTGLLDARTKAQLATASHPTPTTQGGPGKRAEVLLDRQIALLIKDNKVVRTIPVSTGKPSTPTPPGDYRVYAKIPRWWSTPFREWLPWALPFVGGIAFHELQDVPVFPASHGCVRQSYTVAHWTYDFAQVGMPVKVIANS
jgi:peptidoglycan hydrolase-like protein with peptidoglycan-binding domain